MKGKKLVEKCFGWRVVRWWFELMILRWEELVWIQRWGTEMRGWRGCCHCYCCHCFRSMVVGMVDRAADRVGRAADRAADRVVGRVAGGSYCCFRKADKGMEEVEVIHSHIFHL